MCVVSSFEKHSIPSAVEDVMNDKQDSHDDAKPFMQYLSANLICHQTEQDDTHAYVER